MAPTHPRFLSPKRQNILLSRRRNNLLRLRHLPSPDPNSHAPSDQQSPKDGADRNVRSRTLHNRLFDSQINPDHHHRENRKFNNVGSLGHH